MNPFKDPEMIKILYKIVSGEVITKDEEEEFKNVFYKKAVDYAREIHNNMMKEKNIEQKLELYVITNHKSKIEDFEN